MSHPTKEKVKVEDPIVLGGGVSDKSTDNMGGVLGGSKLVEASTILSLKQSSPIEELKPGTI